MNGDALTCAVSHVGCRLHLLEAKGFKARYVLVAAGGAVHFDPVRSGGKLLPGCALHVRDTIGAARVRLGGAGSKGVGCDVQTTSRDEHSRADHGPTFDKISHRKVVAVP